MHRPPCPTRPLFVPVLAWLLVPIAPCAAAEPEVRFRAEPGRLRIEVAGRPFATYVVGDKAITRPYFADVRSPGGVRVTRNHPPVAGEDPTDHATMHPGVWLAFGDLSGSDNWRNRARVEHERYVHGPSGGEGQGTFTVANRYLADNGATIGREVCRYAVLVRQAGYLLTAESEFSPEAAELVFGDQEEMGFGVRVATPLSVKNGGRLRDSEGHENERQVWGKASAWCDAGGVVDGRRVGVTVMASPANFRPSWFHARDYGLVVANPFGRKAFTRGEPSRVVVRRGETLRLGFALLVHDVPERDQGPDLAAAYRDYLQQAGLADNTPAR